MKPAARRQPPPAAAPRWPRAVWSDSSAFTLLSPGSDSCASTCPRLRPACTLPAFQHVLLIVLSAPADAASAEGRSSSVSSRLFVPGRTRRDLVWDLSVGVLIETSLYRWSWPAGSTRTRRVAAAWWGRDVIGISMFIRVVRTSIGQMANLRRQLLITCVM